jgi:hypothetical protein
VRVSRCDYKVCTARQCSLTASCGSTETVNPPDCRVDFFQFTDLQMQCLRNEQLLCIHSCTVSPALRDASLVLCVLIRRQNFVQHTAIVNAQLNEAPAKQAQSQHILCIVAAAVVACNSTDYAALLGVYSVLYCCQFVCSFRAALDCCADVRWQ